jgi:hypothetical protein
MKYSSAFLDGMISAFDITGSDFLSRRRRRRARQRKHVPEEYNQILARYDAIRHGKSIPVEITATPQRIAEDIRSDFEAVGKDMRLAFRQIVNENEQEQ